MPQAGSRACQTAAREEADRLACEVWNQRMLGYKMLRAFSLIFVLTTRHSTAQKLFPRDACRTGGSRPLDGPFPDLPPEPLHDGVFEVAMFHE
jgi:hypothetical protein